MSFDNLRNNASPKNANLFFMILLTAAASVITVFIPLVSFASLAFIPVPAAILLLLNRTRDSLICAIAGMLFLFIFNYILAIVFTIIIIAIAFNYKYMLVKKWTLAFSIGSVFLIMLSTILLFFIANTALRQQNFFNELSSAYNVYVNNLPEDPFIKNYQNFFSMGSTQFDELIAQMQSILRFIPKLLPGVLITYFSMVTIFNYIFSFLILKKFSVNLKPLPDFKKWDIQWYWCWGVIAGIIMVIIPPFGSRLGSIINVLGYNIIIIFGFLYLVLGTAALWGLLDRFNVKNSIKFTVMAVIYLFPGFLIFIPFFGLIDIWANFRKLKRSP